ncbi:MAG TPA: isochorismatase family cysteine hydrolase [Candidatus Saccharimonadales bacterium]|nr:isochorismatase family cysteine hydrolase [Candidatus Saccharimonadales bacterium]
MGHITHPSGIRQEIVDKVVKRRGRLHAYERINPTKTALVVVDLDTATTKRMGSDTDIMRIIQPINQIAAALRAYEGVVAWVTSPIQKANPNFRAIFGEETTKMYEEEGKPGGEGHTLWHELDTKPGDIYVTKKRSSAFFPGNCNLHEQLQKLSIDTLLITGTVTNICCEASARDAAELDYKVIMVSDAMQGHAWGLHEAALATFFRVYGDVRPTKEVIRLIEGT